MKKSSNVGGGAQGTAAKNAATDGHNVMEFYSLEFGRMRTTQDENDETLFCGKDVCDALGYARPNDAIRQHVNNLDTVFCRIKVPGSLRKDGTRTMRSQKMLFVNESGFYALVLGSKLETAQQFKHWVTSEVLPAIRKNGGYFHINPDETPEQIKARFEKVLEEALAQNKKLIDEQTTRIRELDELVGNQVVAIQKKSELILDLESDIDRMQPKELYVDNVLDSISCFTTTQIAKELGITAQELNRSLCACRIQYYQSGQYLLYADYAHLGLAKSRTHYETKNDHIYTHAYLVWTERGRKFIHDLAKRLLDEARLYEQMQGKVSVK